MDPLSINGPLLVARAQARLDSEEARGDAMLGQLAAVSGAAGFVLTIGGTVLITVQPRDLPLQHRLLGVHLGFHLGTVLALVFGVLGFGALILVMTGLQALKDPRYRSRTPQLRIGGFVGQLSSRSSDVVREQLTEMALQEPEVLLANHRRALLVGRMGALFVAGFVSIVLFTTIMLFGSAKPAEVKIISGSPPATTTNTATTTTNSP